MILMFYKYDVLGRYTGTMTSFSDVDISYEELQMPNNATNVAPPEYDESIEIPVWSDGKWVVISNTYFDKPGHLYHALWNGEMWVEGADIDMLKSFKCDEIKNAWLNEINTVGMPVEGYSFNVDFDVEDAIIWQESIQFVGPEVTEVEVRAIDNTFHTIPKSVYESIPTLQKAYYAKMLQKKWELQKRVDAAITKEELEQITW